MLEKLAQIETRYQELTNELSSPELLSNPAAYGKAAKQHRGLAEIVEKYRAHTTLKEELAGAQDLFEHAADEEMRELARCTIVFRRAIPEHRRIRERSSCRGASHRLPQRCPHRS